MGIPLLSHEVRRWGRMSIIANNIKVNGKMAFRGSEFKVSAVGGLAALIVSFIIQVI